MSSVIKARRDVERVTWSAIEWTAAPAPVLEDIPEPLEMPPPEPAGPTPEDLAREILERAEEEAREIVERAHSQAEQVRETARQDGFTAGSAAGEADWARRKEELEDRAGAMMAERDAFYETAEPELAGLVMEIARKVLKQELVQSPEAVLKVVRAAVRRVRDKHMRILVNPADLDLVRDERDTFLHIADGGAEIEIISDRRVGAGGCVVETPNGNVDARIETQLTRIEEALELPSEGGETGDPDASR